MTIVVDQPTWPWRGRLWAHLTSDASMRELHRFAERLEIPRRGFGGDHYDVPDEYVSRVVAAGAQVVTGRELVTRLTAAGLRRRQTAPPLDPRVLLVGLMGAGKTTVGRVVAARTGWTYVDNDALLAQIGGLPLAEAADDLGGDGLHDLELECLRQEVELPAPLVGGAAASVIDRSEGRALLREAYAVYLRARVETLVARVGDGAARPWLDGDAEGVIRRQSDERGPLFERTAALVVDVDEGDPVAVAARIVRAVGQG